MPKTVRIDKWLWAARFLKTRSLATKECTAGNIKRGATPLKPAASIQVGDHLEIPSADGIYQRHIEITALLDKRVSAPLAREAYLDHTPEDVLAAAKERRAIHLKDRLQRQEGDQGRMTKKKRREWNSGLHGFNDGP
jgi:ribosome-associated heat shock protein Hsp15